jgi:predicted nuclease of predicted toxin-antitoxin system
MRVLLDHNVNPRYARLLPEHQVTHSYKMGWAELLNGDLIAAAEQEGFDAIITADKSMQYQQTITSRKIAIIVLNARSITWPHIEPLAPQVNEALDRLHPGAFFTVNPESAA